MNNKTNDKATFFLPLFLTFFSILGPSRDSSRQSDRLTMLSFIEIEIRLEQITPDNTNSINQRKLGCRVN